MGRVPVFIGDDVTDDTGFDAVNALERLTIRVGKRSETGARYYNSDVCPVIEWLDPMSD